jgi:hypothetical protein
MRRALVWTLALCCVLATGVAASSLLPPAAGAGPADERVAEPPAVHGAASQPGTLAALAADDSGACANATFLVCVPGTTNFLGPPRDAVVVRSNNDSSLDLSATLSAETTALDGQFRDETLRVSFSRAETDAARRAILERHTNRVEARTAELRAAERDALESYNVGDLSTRGYLQRLARIDAAGDQLRGTVDRLDSYRLRAPEANVSERRLGGIRADLVALDGPVRERVQSVYAGSRPPTRVFVETGESSVVLSTIVERNDRRLFVREAYVGEVRRLSTGEDRYRDDIVEALSRAEALYPWALSHGDFGGARGNAEVYSVKVTQPRGGFDLLTYLDGQSGSVFAERQEKDVALVPTTTRRTVDGEAGLVLTTQRSYGGGPLNVTVTDSETGDPVDAAVRLNNMSVGRTGANGTLWTVSPRTVFVSVAAEVDGETVGTTVVGREQQSNGSTTTNGSTGTNGST